MPFQFKTRNINFVDPALLMCFNILLNFLLEFPSDLIILGGQHKRLKIEYNISNEIPIFLHPDRKKHKQSGGMF